MRVHMKPSHVLSCVDSGSSFRVPHISTALRRVGGITTLQIKKFMSDAKSSFELDTWPCSLLSFTIWAINFLQTRPAAPDPEACHCRLRKGKPLWISFLSFRFFLYRLKSADALAPSRKDNVHLGIKHDWQQGDVKQWRYISIQCALSSIGREI